MTAREVANVLHISIRTFYAMRASGEFPLKPLKLGGSVRWKVDDVRRWIDAGAPNLKLWDALERGLHR